MTPNEHDPPSKVTVVMNEINIPLKIFIQSKHTYFRDEDIQHKNIALSYNLHNIVPGALPIHISLYGTVKSHLNMYTTNARINYIETNILLIEFTLLYIPTRSSHRTIGLWCGQDKLIYKFYENSGVSHLLITRIVWHTVSCFRL